MDFGLLCLDGLMVGSDTSATASASASPSFASLLVSDPETKQKLYGSGLLNKQERSCNNEDDESWRSPKLAKSTDDFSASKVVSLQQRNSSLLRSNTSSLFSDCHQQMLSFSSPKSEAFSAERTPQNVATFPYFQLTSTSASNRNNVTGYYNNSSGIYNGTNMHGTLAGCRGPFTPSQWMELEHQALIYKYLTANIPIPSNLLIPIRKAFESAGFSSFPGSLLRPNSLGWGTFHLGFSNSTDTEPGRCRRTDGKKWRCSRDAVADQKYCERHMNRGRHRSRKPVEGQSGHSVASTTTATAASTANSKHTVSTTTTTATNSPVMGAISNGGGSSGNLAIAQQQLKTLQPGATTVSSAATTPSINRMFLNAESLGDKIPETPCLSVLDSKSKENSFLIPKQQIPYEEISHDLFGVVSSQSLLNPSHRSSSLMSCKNYRSSQEISGQGTRAQHHPLRQFIDDWPKAQSDRSGISWPEVDHMQSDRTQLSISIPMAASDFMSSTSSPGNEKVTLSPLRLSREFDPIQMGLGVGSVINQTSQRQANWIPISWENSVGGPLGEVLNNTSNNTVESKNPSALNLMTEGWDNSSPRIGSSPTGVLQKTAFGSMSNSSAGSSPRMENNRTQEGASLCNNDHLGSNLLPLCLPCKQFDMPNEKQEEFLGEGRKK